MKYEIVGTNFYDASGYESGSMESFYESQMNDYYNQYFIGMRVIFRFWDSSFDNTTDYSVGYSEDVNECLDSLAIKDGVNFVRYENGNHGFIGYYNSHENGIEIMLTECPINL